jgi:hypothetical protein
LPFFKRFSTTPAAQMRNCTAGVKENLTLYIKPGFIDKHNIRATQGGNLNTGNRITERHVIPPLPFSLSEA